MEIDNSSAKRRLAMRLPFEFIEGVKVNLGSTITVKITLMAKNVDRCILSLDYDKKVFESKIHGGDQIEFTQENETKKINILLIPHLRTVKPVWISVMVTSDTLAQVGGFFVQVV